MSKTKHTPGPWEVGFGGGLTGPRCAPTVYLDEPDAMITSIPIRKDNEPVAWIISCGGSRRVMDADAYLIAAAPELLEALEATLALAAAWSGAYTVQHNLPAVHNNHQQIIDSARAAIDKAKGRS